MIVVLADNIPPAIRGKMKLFFIEIKPGIFVSGVKDNVAKDVSDFLYSNCPIETSFAIIESTKTPPYYKIRKRGSDSRKITKITGLQLILDKQNIS